MNKFELTSAFLIGHTDIDHDHAELVRLLNEMVDCYGADDIAGCAKMWPVFCHKLEKHFSDEEIIMREMGFDDGGDHEGLHQEIVRIAENLGRDCHYLDDWKVCLMSLRDNLLTTILKHDLKFAEHLVTIGYND